MQAMTRYFLAATSIILLAVWLASASAQVAAGPMAQVKETVDAILATLKDDSLTREVRRKQIRNLINRRFDYRTMSQRTLAVNWKKASPAVRDRFIKLFSKMLESTYMGRIEAYTNERVEYVKERIKGKKAIVDTGNVDIPITYRLRRKGDQWLVYDVKIEEVSLIRNYRSSYGEIVRKEGFDGLLAKMEARLNTQANATKTN